MKLNSLMLMLSTFAILVVLFNKNVANGETAYFAFKTHGSYNDFIFKLDNDKDIKTARNILNGTETETIHVMGRIKKTKKDYNPNYSFILDPDQVSFFQMAIEVCDASPSYVDDHLDEACGAFLPGCYWCPWSSRLTKEVNPSEIIDSENYGFVISVQ